MVRPAKQHPKKGWWVVLDVIHSYLPREPTELAECRWSWIDAVVVTRSVLGEKFPFTFWLPGMVSTLVLVLLNMVPRNALSEASSYGDDEEREVRDAW